VSIKLVKKRIPCKDGIYKNSENWYLRGTVRGIPCDESTGTSNRRSAEIIRVRRETELLDRSILGAKHTMSFAEAARNYMNSDGEDRFLPPLIKHFGFWVIAEIDQPALDQAAKVIYPKATNETRSRQVYTPVVAILRHAGIALVVHRPNQKKPGAPRPNRDYALPEYYNQLINEISDLPHLRRLVLFMTYSGRRVGECVRLNWDADIDLPNRLAYMGKTKNGEDITIPILSPFFEELANVEDKHGPVFGYTDPKSPNRTLKRRCQKLGIPYLSCHKLGRHTFATWMRRYGGLDRSALKEAGGWKSTASVEHYMHVMPDELPDARAKLPQVGKDPGSAPNMLSKILRKKGV